MSAVCYDWSPVGYSSHPVPGNADEVDEAARGFHRTADNLRDVLGGLRMIDSSETSSTSIDKLLDSVREIMQVVTQAMERYRIAGDALTAYSPALRRAQRDAEQALEAAAASRREYEQAAAEANRLRVAMVGAILDPQDAAQKQQQWTAAKGRSATAQGAFLQAKSRIQAAVASRDQAAEAAAQRIHATVDGSSLNDSLVDRLREIGRLAKELAEFVHENVPGVKAAVDGLRAAGEWVWNNLDLIAAGLAIAALAFCWVPGLGPALLLASKVVGTVATAKSLAEGAIHWRRTGDPGAFANAAIGAAAGFGVGKLVGAGTRAVGKRVLQPFITEAGTAARKVGVDSHTVLSVVRTTEDLASQKNFLQRQFSPEHLRHLVAGTSDTSSSLNKIDVIWGLAGDGAKSAPAHQMASVVGATGNALGAGWSASASEIATHVAGMTPHDVEAVR